MIGLHRKGEHGLRRSRDSMGGYRGRRTLTDILMLIALALVVLVVLLLGGLLLGQRYIVYTDNGLRLDLPFGQSDQDNQVVEPGDISMIERHSASSEEEGPIAEPETTVLSAITLPLEAVLNGTAAQQLEQAGANGLVLDMKTTDGRLNWVSQQPLAGSFGVNGQDASINDALRQWNEGEVHTVARVCCFRDDTVPYQRNDMAMRATYGNWRDELGLRWMDPASEAVQEYLAALCGELAELGFDEILLECGTYPTQGNQEAITTSIPADRGAVVEQFLERVRQAVEPHGVQVSLRVETSVLTEENDLSGLDLEAVDGIVDRIWTGADGAETLAAWRDKERLVCLKTELAAEPNQHQAVLECL